MYTEHSQCSHAYMVDHFCHHLRRHVALQNCICAFSLSGLYTSPVFTVLQVAQQMLLEDAPLSLQQTHTKLLHGLFKVSATCWFASARAALNWGQPSLGCKLPALAQAALGWG